MTYDCGNGVTGDGSKSFLTVVTGTHKNLTLTYGGQVISNAFTLIVSDTDEELNYPAYPEEGSVRVDKQGTTTEEDFSATGVANIQLSATGIPRSRASICWWSWTCPALWKRAWIPTRICPPSMKRPVFTPWSRP